MRPHTDKSQSAIIMLACNFPQFQHLRRALMHRAAPTQRSRRRTKKPPRLFGAEMRCGAIEGDAIRLALRFHGIDKIVCIGKFHARIAEDNDETALGQRLLHEIKENTAVLAARESNMKAIKLCTILLVDSDDLLHRRLLDESQHLTILLDHARKVDRVQHCSLRQQHPSLLILHQLDLRRRIDISALELRDQYAAIVIGIGFRPQIRHIVLTLILPIRIKAQDVKLRCIDRARFLRHPRRRRIQEYAAHLGIICIGINFKPSLSPT